MRIFITIALLLLLIPVAGAQETTPTATPTPESDTPLLADLIAEAEALSTFRTALGFADEEFTALLNEPEGELTVFAPSDAAFQELQTALGDAAFAALLNDPELITPLLAYHVSAFSGVTELESEQPFLLQSAQGQHLDLLLTEDGALLVDEIAVEAEVQEAANGRLYIIETVLQPEVRTVADIIASRQMSGLATLQEMMLAASPDIFTLLADPEADITLFAPSDDAFLALGQTGVTNLLTAPDILNRILSYHITEERIYAYQLPALLEDSDSETLTLEMLSGDELTLSFDEDGVLLVNGIPATITEIEATNGVIHILEGLLSPANQG